jgi:hypothetical protein
MKQAPTSLKAKRGTVQKQTTKHAVASLVQNILSIPDTEREQNGTGDTEYVDLCEVSDEDEDDEDEDEDEMDGGADGEDDDDEDRVRIFRSFRDMVNYK